LGPFVVIAAFGLSYVASLVCGIVGMAFIASRSPRLEWPAFWVGMSGLLVMGVWLVVVVWRAPELLGLNVLATVVGSVPLVLCAIAVWFAAGRRWLAKRKDTRYWTGAAGRSE
jgi:hypothetical protein